MQHGIPIDIIDWAAKHADQLGPPVCNKCIFKGDEIECMLVAGPNDRTDFHVNPTEEFFYQLKGDLVLTVMESVEGVNVRNKIRVKQGECYLLPSKVPHNPRRADCSLGLVIERRRPSGVMDKLVWYCSNCNGVMREHSFICSDLDANILDAINESKSHCSDLCSYCEIFSKNE